MLQKRAP
jgi:hypothetical protein